MATTPFQFTPTQGLRDSTAYPTNPGSEAAARDQIQKGMDQQKDFINNTLLPALDGKMDGKVLSGGNKIQSGTAFPSVTQNVWSTNTITFPTAFSSPPVVLACYAQNTNRAYIAATNPTTTSFVLNVDNIDGTGINTITWIAVGS